MTSSAPFYTLGLQKTLVIVGLGNVGKKYDGTRHNVGFSCIDNLAAKLEFEKWVEKTDLKCLITQQNIGDNRIILIKPTTFMNLSGEAMQAVCHFYKIPSEQVVAIYDELDIPFGQIRTRLGGSSAGHNGVESLINQLGENFGRVRIGINNDIAKQTDSKNFVLGKFTSEEQKQLSALTREVNSILSEYAHGQPLVAETRDFLI